MRTIKLGYERYEGGAGWFAEYKTGTGVRKVELDERQFAYVAELLKEGRSTAAMWYLAVCV